MARLVLVGLPGVGKTTVAQALGLAFDCSVRDTDAVFADREGASVQQVLRERGEVVFRALEAECLASLIGEDVIISTGGGIVTTAQSRALLKGEPTFWLDAPDEVLLTRVGDGDRPLLGDAPAERLVTLRAEREAFYEEVATVRIDASGDVATTVAAILSHFEGVDS